MKTTTDSITQAITRSISHTEIAHTTFRGTPEDALSEVYAGCEDYDHSTENNGDLYVWGTTDSGEDFRIRITLDPAGLGLQSMTLSQRRQQEAQIASAAALLR